MSLSRRAQERKEGKGEGDEVIVIHFGSPLTTEPLNYPWYRLLRLKGPWGTRMPVRDKELGPLKNAQKRHSQ